MVWLSTLRNVPAGQVPGVAGPEALEVVALDELGGHRLNAPAHPGHLACCRSGPGPRRACGTGAKNAMPARGQLLAQQRMPGIPIPQHLPRGPGHHLGGYLQVGGVGWGELRRRHDTRPAGAHMPAEAIEEGLAALVVAVGGLARGSGNSGESGRSGRPAPERCRRRERGLLARCQTRAPFSPLRGEKGRG